MRKILVALLLMLGLNAFADDINLWQKSTLNAIIQTRWIFVAWIKQDFLPFVRKRSWRMGGLIKQNDENRQKDTKI